MTNLKSDKEIKIILGTRGITFKDVAKEFNTHYTTIIRYFNGEMKMTADFLYNLAKFADIDLYEFFKREDGQMKPPKKFKKERKEGKG